MERNELIDELRALKDMLPHEQRRTIAAAIDELDSDVMQVVKLTYNVRLLQSALFKAGVEITRLRQRTLIDYLRAPLGRKRSG